MGCSNFKKFRLLLWKNWLLQKRHVLQTFLEIFLPLVFMAALILTRTIIKSEVFDTGVTFPSWSPTDLNGTVVNKNLDDISRTNNLIGPLRIYYAPENDMTNLIMRKAREEFFVLPVPKSNQSVSYSLKGFEDEEKLVEFYKNETSKSVAQVYGAVIFTNLTQHFQYKLRFPAKQQKVKNSSISDGEGWKTNLLFTLFQNYGPRSENDIYGGAPGYHSQGFIRLQFALDLSIINYFNRSVKIQNMTMEDSTVQLQRFPYPSYTFDPFISALQQWFPLVLMLSLIYPVVNITKSVVLEKERRLKESMKLIGVDGYLHWSAWFVKSFMFLWISIILMVIFLKVSWYENGRSVLTYADGTLFFVFLMVFTFSSIMLAFLVSTFCSKANSASTIMGVVWFLTYFPYFFLKPRYDHLSLPLKLCACVLSNTAMAFGCQLISMFEGTGAGSQWSNLLEGPSTDDQLTLLHCSVMMIVDGILYFVLAIYIEAVWPGEVGIGVPWYLPFSKSYWFDTGSKSQVSTTADSNNNNNNSYKIKDTENPNFQSDPSGLNVGIKIKELTKKFGGNVAVNGINLNVYEDQITVFLGSNGSGKTTLFSMLSGFLCPSSGTAILNDIDLVKNSRRLRNNLGYCPQHNILFDELTVQEHLHFFSQLKGCRSVEFEVKRMLTAVGLELKSDRMSKMLSGGLKRKLSLAIALVGGSKVILLDEPTSGMDPGSRRSAWDLLKSERKGRTILLSTHFMDEADFLGDRIAIMVDGKLATVGSSLYLKKRYGEGYRLTIVKQNDCRVSEVTALLKKHLHETTLREEVGAELSYTLPDHKSHLFGKLLEELESRQKELSIDSYGVNSTSMEQVFENVGKRLGDHGESIQKNDTHKISIEKIGTRSTSQHSNIYDDQNNEREILYLRQLWALMIKKGIYSVRNSILLSVQILVPVAFLILALTMLHTLPSNVDPPELQIGSTGYGSTVTTLSCPNSAQDNDDICEAYAQFVQDQQNGVVEYTSARSLSMVDYLKEKNEENLVQVNSRYIVGMEKIDKNLTCFFNNQPYHGLPMALNYLTNTLFKTWYNANSSITVTNFPLPFTNWDNIENQGKIDSTGFQVGFHMAFGMSFLASSFLVFLIKERESKSKHLQFISGVKFWMFWLAHFTFDFLLFLIPSVILVLLLIAFQAESFTESSVLSSVLVLLLFYGWSIIPLMYLCSFWFNVPSSGFTRMWFFNAVTGLGPVIMISMLKNPDLELESTAKVLDWIFLVSPNYCLVSGVVQLSKNNMLQQICPPLFIITGIINCEVQFDHECCSEFNYGYMDWNVAGIGRQLSFMFVLGFLSFFTLAVKEGHICFIVSKKIGTQNKKTDLDGPHDHNIRQADVDVLAEEERIANENLKDLQKSDNLIIKDVSKFYGKFRAVKRLNLGVHQGECFGLLGTNGAGKSSIFKILTGDLPVTSGDAFIYGHSVSSDIGKVQKHLGYCPQFDALINELTGRETIQLYARLRGIYEADINYLVDKLSTNLLLNEHMDKRVEQYSGGTKRKLSTALALVGNPPLILLDEPTTGMDQFAKRHLWNCINKVRREGTSIVLTSHSMEECEALCTRLMIMVNGEARCLGTPQHLKSKFGEGYTVIVQIGSQSQGTINDNIGGHKGEDWETRQLEKWMQDMFPGSTLQDVHSGYLHFHVHNKDVTWSDLFSQMEIARTKFDLEAYSISQTTLEQIFLNFTKPQITHD